MFNSIFKNKKDGFSILEIVVVVVVIAFFAMLIIPGLISGPARARDATRKNDVRLIKSALENYYNQFGYYPAKLDELEKTSTPFIKKLPKDPKTGKDYVYITTGNPPSTYVIQATLENKNDKDLKSKNNDPTTGIYTQGSSN